MTKDIVCNMDIDEKNSIKEEHNNQKYYFCSESCRNQFIKDPEKYLDKLD